MIWTGLFYSNIISIQSFVYIVFYLSKYLHYAADDDAGSNLLCTTVELTRKTSS